MSDTVNHPQHYTSHPSGVECITVTEHMGFNVGNAVKYLWRADLKGDALEDLRKAAWYVQREIERRRGAAASACGAQEPSSTERCALPNGHGNTHHESALAVWPVRPPRLDPLPNPVIPGA